MKAFMMNNILLTRSCNLSCDYCRIVRDYDNSPYKKLYSYEILDYVKWVEFAEWLKSYHGNDFFIILYGGEPMIYPYIEDLVAEYNRLDIPYTIITNATKREKTLKLVKDGLRGLSCSVDPLIFKDESSDRSRKLKSSKGLSLLVEAKKLNPDLDAVAEITIDNTNIQYVRKLVELLSEHDIYASLTIIESSKNRYYDFAEPCDDLLLTREQMKELANEIRDMVKQGYKIHTPEAILYILEERGYDTQCDLHEIYHTTSIEPNGEIRLCLRIKGIYVSHNIFDYIEKGLNPEQVARQISFNIQQDMVVTCQGCAWTCVHMHRSGIKNIQHVS